MLFMGEEYAEPHPFLYFISHTDPALVEAVRKGRKAEFAAFQALGEAPDPDAEETFNQSKLQWDLTQQEPHWTMLRYYKALLALRKEQPALRQLNRQQLEVAHQEETKTLFLRRWTDDQQIICLLNFSKAPQPYTLPTDTDTWQKLLNSADPLWKGPAAAPDTISAEDTITIPPESILVYGNTKG
jgi:maltooligosyltrehalose trehalohydrolase